MKTPINIRRFFRSALASLIFFPCSVWGQGSLTPPPGPPAPLMKTLEQVEPRTLIRNDFDTLTPIVITTSGSYYLGEDILAFHGQHGIEINASDVTLDLNGFKIQGNTEVGSQDGVRIGPNANNVSISNGTIKSFFGVGIHTPVYGEGYGIFSPTELRVTDVRLQANGGGGLRAGNRAMVVNCIAIENLGYGFLLGESSRITGSTARGNTGNGIEINSFSHVTGNICDENQQNGIYTWRNSSVISGNSASANTLNGIFISGVTSGNRIDSNQVNSNEHGIRVEGSGNLITRNFSRGNWQGHYIISANNKLGAIAISPDGAGPWDNF